MPSNKWQEGYNHGLSGGSAYSTDDYNHWEWKEGWCAGFDERQRREEEKNNRERRHEEEEENQERRHQELLEALAVTSVSATAEPEPAAQRTAQFCGDCGAKVEPGSRFCENCGAPQ